MSISETRNDLNGKKKLKKKNCDFLQSSFEKIMNHFLKNIKILLVVE